MAVELLYGEQLCTVFDDVHALCQLVAMHLPQTAKSECGTRRVLRRSKCFGSESTRFQAATRTEVFTTALVIREGCGRQYTTLPVWPSANHTLGTFTLTMAVGNGDVQDEGIWNIAFVLSGRILEQRRKSKTSGNGGSLQLHKGGRGLRSAARCAEADSWSLW